jgi:Hemerythrin HHE cation binding domain
MGTRVGYRDGRLTVAGRLLASSQRSHKDSSATPHLGVPHDDPMTTNQLNRPIPSSADLTDQIDPTEGYDFYREIHKGIRLAMFELVLDVGRLDVSEAVAVDRALADHAALFDMLDLHHAHEDTWIQPLIIEHAPVLGRMIDAQHHDVNEGMAHLRTLADRLANAAGARRRAASHRLYLDLSELTSVYLAHQLVEETAVMPTLRAAVPTDELIALDQSIRASIPPEAMAHLLGFVLRAMNVDERAKLGIGMSMAPPEVIAGFRAVAAESLSAADWTQITDRLGIA